MLLRSGIKTGSNQVEKRNTRLSKLKSHLPFLCACFKGPGKQRRHLITAANRRQIESISEIALNLLKGNILIPKSSFERLKPYKDKLLYLTRKNPATNRRKKCLMRKEAFYQRLPDSFHPLLASCSIETRTKDDVGSRAFIAKSSNRTPINIPTATRNTHAFGSRHETDNGFFITRRPKNRFARSTFPQISKLKRR